MSKFFPVHMRLAGNFYLLHWWTQDDRGHLVLARNQSSLVTVAERVFRENTDAELKSYIRVEIVAAPVKFIELNDKYDRLMRIGVFYDDIAWRIKQAPEAGETLPYPFSVCHTYSPDEYSPETPDDQEWAISCHHDCKNCSDHIAMDMTKEDLYDRYAAAWYEQYPEYQSNYVSKEVRYASHGRVAEIDEPLSYAVRNFGNHSSGVELEKINSEEGDGICRPRWLSEDVLFFYNMIEVLDFTSLQRSLDAVREKAKVDREKLAAFRVSERKRDEIETAREVIEFFRNHKQ